MSECSGEWLSCSGAELGADRRVAHRDHRPQHPREPQWALQARAPQRARCHQCPHPPSPPSPRFRPPIPFLRKNLKSCTLESLYLGSRPSC
eukprot:scaffold127738_cov30-Tisochrysis_lutea.AAC.5